MVTPEASFRRMVEAEEAYRKALVAAYGAQCGEARFDARATATPELSALYNRANNTRREYHLRWEK